MIPEPHLTADIPLANGTTGRLAHPLLSGTFGEAVKWWRLLAPFLPAGTVWSVTVQTRGGQVADTSGGSAAGATEEAGCEGGGRPEEAAVESGGDQRQRGAAVPVPDVRGGVLDTSEGGETHPG